MQAITIQPWQPIYRVEFVENPNHRCCMGAKVVCVYVERDLPTEEARVSQAIEKVKLKFGSYVTIDRCVRQ